MQEYELTLVDNERIGSGDSNGGDGNGGDVDGGGVGGVGGDGDGGVGVGVSVAVAVAVVAVIALAGHIAGAVVVKVLQGDTGHRPNTRGSKA
ncbi:hypothetical protein E0Z10_g2932 [Xylaria hypoxylon]|uniref:Uncharacterized protein n=1 Tax=Xylaria hypoxylon TaxID=37992 RepID=A0A4Z0Z353_9PEZI|nr:hypothetical protein E0Z10_g2932 [Xylaria hypoxylon]